MTRSKLQRCNAEVNDLGARNMADFNCYLEFSEGTSHKFYAVEVLGTTVVIRYGRIGTEGRREEEHFPDAEAARKFAEQKVTSKKRAGYQPAEPGVSEKKAIEKVVLDEAGKFWKLIELARKGTGGDSSQQVENIAERLAKLSVEEIFSFYRELSRCMAQSYRADLWGAAYIVNGGCSDDSFDYFRAWLILQGERAFRAALEDPDSIGPMVKRAQNEGVEVEAEELMYVAIQAYENLTGKDDFYDACACEPTGELQGDIAAWEDVDSTQVNARRLYPKLCKAFLEKPDV